MTIITGTVVVCDECGERIPVLLKLSDKVVKCPFCKKEVEYTIADDE